MIRTKQCRKVSVKYNKFGGTKYEYICLNVYHQRLSVKQYEHKGGTLWLEFLKEQRSKCPLDDRVYVIQDGLPTHWIPEIRRWARASNTTLVPTATNAS